MTRPRITGMAWRVVAGIAGTIGLTPAEVGSRLTLVHLGEL